MIEPTDAAFEGDRTLVGRRVARTMLRRLPAFFAYLRDQVREWQRD